MRTIGSQTKQLPCKYYKMPRKRSNLSRYSRNAKRMRLLRTEESEEDREARLTAARERQARTRASETPTQREYRLSIQRARTATYRSRESNEQRKERLSACRQRMALSRKLKLSQDMSNATRFCDMARSIFITNGIDAIKEDFTSDAFETVLHNGDNEFSFDMEGAIGKVPLKPFLQNGDDEFSIDIKDVIKREIVEFSETNSLSHIPVQQKPCEYAETFAENKVPLPEANVDVKAETNCEFFDPILENKDEIFLNEAKVDVKAEIDHGFSEPILENKAEIFLNEVRADVKAETDNEFLETVSENKHGIFLQENLNEGHTISISFSDVLDGIKQEAAVNDPLENILDIPERTSSNVEDEIDYFVVAKDSILSESEKESTISATQSDYCPLDDFMSSASDESSNTSIWNNGSGISPIISSSEVSEAITPSDTPFVALDASSAACEQKRLRRKHTCPFCNLECGNFSRHLERNHDNEPAVKEFLNLPKNSTKRKKLIDKIRREGDFCTSSTIPVMQQNKSSTEFIVCKFCKGYYAEKSLRRHAKHCYFNPDPSKRFKARIEGQTIMAGDFGPNDILNASGILNMLRADDVSMVIKKDPIICEVGRRYIRCHKEKHLLLVAKRHMRRLARLLIAARTLDKNNCLKLIDILSPKKFKLLSKATREISGYGEASRTFESPSLALQMGTIIKSAINTAYCLEIQKPDSSCDRTKQFKDLLVRIDTDWAREISTEANQSLAINKFSKPSLIPVAKDIGLSSV